MNSVSVRRVAMRWLAALLALVASCAVLAACGKGAYTVTTSARARTGVTAEHGARPGGGAQSGDSSGRAHALAFAHAVNLTAADVPGFTPTHEPKHESSAEKRLEGQLRKCSGATGTNAPQHARGALIEVESPNFKLKRGVLTLGVSSEVSVARTPAEADATLAATRSPRVRACFSRYLTALLKSQHYPGATPLGVSIVSGTPPAPGTSGGFAWRVTATLSIRTIQISFYYDILGFVKGSAQVTLTSSGTIRPFPARAQEQLYSELLARARAHSV